MKKYLLALVLSLMTFQVLTAQYQKMEIFEMVGTADVVVMGTIQEVKPLTMVVEVKDKLIGECGTSVEVEKFKGAKDAKRWGKYLVGEQVLLFLIHDGSGYKLQGVGGEGEKLVVGEEVYLDNRGGALFNRFNYLTLSTGASIYAEKVSLKDFTDAVKGLKSLFTVEYNDVTNVAGEVSHNPVAVPVGDGSKTDEYASRSDLHNKLVQDCLKHPKP